MKEAKTEKVSKSAFPVTKNGKLNAKKVEKDDSCNRCQNSKNKIFLNAKSETDLKNN